jgi:hypothetical protein
VNAGCAIAAASLNAHAVVGRAAAPPLTISFTTMAQKAVIVNIVLHPQSKLGIEWSVTAKLTPAELAIKPPCPRGLDRRLIPKPRSAPR